MPNRGFSKNGELPNNKMHGITKDLHDLRALPKYRRKNKWCSNGGKISQLMAALLRSRGLDKESLA